MGFQLYGRFATAWWRRPVRSCLSNGQLVSPRPRRLPSSWPRRRHPGPWRLAPRGTSNDGFASRRNVACSSMTSAQNSMLESFMPGRTDGCLGRSIAASSGAMLFLSCRFQWPLPSGEEIDVQLESMPLTHAKRGVPLAPPHSTRTGQPGRAGRNRTRNLRFWRPVLYQLSYDPIERHQEHSDLSSLAVKLVVPATRAKLLQFQSPGIVPAVLFGRVIALAARCALKRNYGPVGPRLPGHCTTFLSSHPAFGRAFWWRWRSPGCASRAPVSLSR